MAEPTGVVFSYAETITALIRAAGLHEGRWTLAAYLGVSAAGTERASGPVPAALVSIDGIGLVRVPDGAHVGAPNVIDAAVVNPRERGTAAEAPPVKGTQVN